MNVSNLICMRTTSESASHSQHVLVRPSLAHCLSGSRDWLFLRVVHFFWNVRVWFNFDLATI